MEKIYRLKNHMTIKKYSNGSYSYLVSANRWRNMRSELAKRLIEQHGSK